MQRFEEGKDILEELGEKVELPPILYEYGLMWKQRGEEEEARRQLKRALSMAEGMGMDLWAERCREHL
ncbi:MAG: hypothetical protein ACOCTR_04215 [Candidatus Natronoplasma sp.]